ncbi:hypothetical protein GCM10028862_12640 [Luteimonas pelagia]
MEFPTPARCVLALTLAGIVGAALAQAPAPAATAEDVETALRLAGYTEIRDIDRDEDGLWQAEVKGDDGLWGEVHVVAATGEVLAVDAEDTVLMDSAQVTTALKAAGYSDIRDLELDEATWEADARNAAGAAVEVRVNARTGAVIHEALEEEEEADR